MEKIKSMKYIFETEDEQEALLFMNGRKFYNALDAIRQMLRDQEKYGFTLNAPYGKVSAIREKINDIIDTEAPTFHDIT